jgi:hypothetical protein
LTTLYEGISTTVISGRSADFIKPLRNHHLYAKASLYVLFVFSGYTLLLRLFRNPKQALSRLLPLNGGIKSAKRKGFKGRGIQGILTLDL